MAYEIADLPEHLRGQAEAQLSGQALAAPAPKRRARPVKADAPKPVKAEQPKPVKKVSALEERFAGLVVRYGMPEPVREYVYAPPRKFRSDFCWLDARLLVELEGGVWGGKSGHNSGVGIERDCERSRLASRNGFRVYRVTRKSLDESEAVIMEGIREIIESTQNGETHRKNN